MISLVISLLFNKLFIFVHQFFNPIGCGTRLTCYYVKSEHLCITTTATPKFYTFNILFKKESALDHFIAGFVSMLVFRIEGRAMHGHWLQIAESLRAVWWKYQFIYQVRGGFGDLCQQRGILSTTYADY